MRTIRVTGKGNLKIKPDMTRITISVEGLSYEYGEALRKSAESTDELKKLLSNFGFERSDLKTLDFSVDTEYESYKERGAYKQRFIGYSYRHRMKVEFDSDNERLGRILYALANSPLTPEFRLSYTVKDPEAAKNQLLEKAVEDAKGKAAVLAKASGLTLKCIQNIDYSWGHIDFEVRPFDKPMTCDCMEYIEPEQSYNIDIEPDDIEVSDTVTVIWEIE